MPTKKRNEFGKDKAKQILLMLKERLSKVHDSDIEDAFIEDIINELILEKLQYDVKNCLEDLTIQELSELLEALNGPHAAMIERDKDLDLKIQ